MRDLQIGESAVVCPVCEKTWPKDLDTCPDDGSWLHEETRVDLHPRAKSTTLQRLPARARDDTSPAALFAHAMDTPQRSALLRAPAEPGLAMAAPPRNPKDLAPGTKASEYVIEAKVGEGGMGAVYRAVHPAIGKVVAIKVMSGKLFDEPDAMQRFLAEARAIAAIRHPGIVDIFGYGRLPDGRTYLTMEWLDGESLAMRQSRAPLARADALDVIRQIARALEAAHGKQIVHRDLKPENVFLLEYAEERVVKLVDFGLAKVGDKDVGVTREGQIVGTPLYMSPEQCRSKGVDHRTDVYALGCLAYQLLAGRVPFDNDNAAELISAHLMAPPPRARSFKPDLPAELDDLLVRMIAKDPAQRPPLGDVRRVIGSVLARESQPIAVTKPPWEQPEDLETASTAHGQTHAPAQRIAHDQTAPDALARDERARWWIPVAIAVAFVVVVALGIFAFSRVFG
ncbi:MAG TPA: serine/threonine-protein kinase [Kofleriaceae bacterium]|nr:serine/threonine-protein kinase [Kofleriaceae bacterium]